MNASLRSPSTIQEKSAVSEIDVQIRHLNRALVRANTLPDDWDDIPRSRKAEDAGKVARLESYRSARKMMTRLKMGDRTLLIQPK